MTGFGPNCPLDQPIRVFNYGDPLRDTGRWTAMERLASRMESVSELFTRLGIDIYANEPVDEPEPPKRDEMWGFAVGDRVRVKEPGAHYGLAGKVNWAGGCSIAKESVICRDICPNVGFIATHRLYDSGVLETVTNGQITVPPSHLEHCD